MSRTAVLKSILIVVLLSVQPLFAETKVAKIIDKNETWTPQLSPYIIEGVTVIEKTGLLNISPGTTVRFKRDAKLLVKGALYAKGSPQNPVRFLPDDNESFYDGIVFESPYMNTVEFSIMIRGAIVSNGSKVAINNNYMLNSTGILLYHFAESVIKDNYFFNNTYGVYMEAKSLKYMITGNSFNKCRFSVYIKEAPAAAGLIERNNFFDSRLHVANYTVFDIQAKNNFWGAAQERDIEKLIFDKKNNPKTGAVIYKPFSTARLKVFEPPPSFASLIKIYLNLKRPDGEPSRVTFGGGLSGFKPLTPDVIKEEENFGMGLAGEFTFNITGAFMAGVDVRMLEFSNNKELYDYNLFMTNMMVNIFWYIGYKKDVFFVPYLKIGNGVSLVTEQYRSKEPIFDGEMTYKPKPQVCYGAQAGIGLELFLLRFFSIKLEGLYNYTFYERGAISYPLVSLMGSVYFDTPFHVNR